SARIGCRRAGVHHRGVAVHGDVDIIPANVDSRWEVEQRDSALLITLPTAIVNSVAEERGLDPARGEILNRFQVRDPPIEHIGWALKARMEEGGPADRLFTESLATALGVRLLERHSTATAHREERISMPGRRLRAVLGYIEDNLARDLSLSELAAIAGI